MKNKLRILFSLVIIFMMFFLLTSCKKSYGKLDHVIHSEIFNINESEYYVYVYRPNCTKCEELEPLVCNYARKAKHNKSLPNLYVLNKGDTLNNSDIYCGEDEYVKFIGATSPKEIKTASSPFLFKIKNGKVVKIIDNVEKSIADELAK